MGSGSSRTGSSRTGSSWPAVLLGVYLAAMLVLGGSVIVSVLGGDGTDRRAAGSPATPGPGSSMPSAERRALGVLRGWDRRRAAAYAAGDVAALGRLYSPGSRTAVRDQALLRRYVARGLRVERMHTQVLQAAVSESTRTSLVLLVADRTVGAVAVGRGVRAALPSGAARDRVVHLTRHGGEWRVDEVTASAAAG